MTDDPTSPSVPDVAPPEGQGRADGGPSPGPAPRATPTASLFTRRFLAGRDFELFIVTAVATILIVRAALAATGYPQLGGGPIHFAHLLWGGLGMLIALVLFMSMEARRLRQLATLSAGIGFGLFIDELGKFVTSNNDYFFQPAVAVIYVVFVVLWLVTAAIARTGRLSPQAALVNVFELAKDAVMGDLDEGEQAATLAMLARCDQSDPIVEQLTAIVRHASLTMVRPERFYLRVKARLAAFYNDVAARGWFRVVVIGWFVVVTIAGVATAARDAVKGDEALGHLTFATKGELVAIIAAGVLVVIGIVLWGRSRTSAYRWFERATLVALLIYEPFAFYVQQVWAVFGVALLLFTYLTIRLFLRQERAREDRDAVASTASR